MRADSTASSLVDAPKMLTFFLAMLSSIPAVCLMIHTPALPAMAVHYGTTEQTVRSIQTGFALAVAIVQISFVFFYAPLAERFGRKRLTIASLAVFSIGSLGCTLADDIGPFLVWRIVQGLGACVGPAVARNLVEEVFKDGQREKAHHAIWIGLIASPAAALLISSGLLRYSGISSVSLLLTLAGLSMAAFACLRLPDTGPCTGSNPVPMTGHRSTLANSKRLLTDRAFLIPALTMAFNLAGTFAYQSDIAFVFDHTFGMNTWVDVWLIGNAAALAASCYWVKERSGLAARSRSALARKALQVRWGVTLALLWMACSGHAEPWQVLALLLVYHQSLGLALGKLQADAMRVDAGLTSTASGLFGALLNSGVLLGTALPLLPLAQDFTRMAVSLFLCATLACITAWNYGRTRGPQAA